MGMKDFTNSYITLTLNKVRNTIIDKITYEEENADTPKVKYYDGTHWGYVQGLSDSCDIIEKYIKQEISHNIKEV